MSRIAIIPARGGSKRIPKKNIRDFLGHPIIKYSIEAAVHSHCFDEIMVSTEDKEIAEKAELFGVAIPFYRSSASAHDSATTADVIEEVLREYGKRNKHFQFCCCIYPAAPFVTTDHLMQSYALLKETESDSVVPVVRFGHPIQRALKIEGGRLSMIQPENLTIRTQDLTPTYHDAGQFYWLRVESFLRQKKLIMDYTVPFMMPESEVQDIDNEEDWKTAEIKYEILKSIK